ncbi:MAG: ATP-binding cassette domain-containing protein [Actinomycetota bacterium]|nr:ATP-binding cassette domain-containing protein [Actinomycetota bacterium]
MNESRPIFRLENGSVVLNGHRALDQVNFEINPGEFMALLGPNGSGKTTLLRALLRLHPLASGRLFIFGQEADTYREWWRIGYVPQRFTAVAGLPASVYEVALSGRVPRTRPFRRFGQEDEDAATAALESVGLERLRSERVDRLSGGQQQRVLIARALAAQPDILVLDEPVSHVDQQHQESFFHGLEDLHQKGHTVILVAHSVRAIADLIERAVVLDEGRVVHDGAPPTGLLEDHVHHDPLATGPPRTDFEQGFATS